MKFSTSNILVLVLLATFLGGPAKADEGTFAKALQEALEKAQAEAKADEKPEIVSEQPKQNPDDVSSDPFSEAPAVKRKRGGFSVKGRNEAPPTPQIDAESTPTEKVAETTTYEGVVQAKPVPVLPTKHPKSLDELKVLFAYAKEIKQQEKERGQATAAADKTLDLLLEHIGNEAKELEIVGNLKNAPLEKLVENLDELGIMTRSEFPEVKKQARLLQLRALAFKDKRITDRPMLLEGITEQELFRSKDAFDRIVKLKESCPAGSKVAEWKTQIAELKKEADVLEKMHAADYLKTEGAAERLKAGYEAAHPSDFETVRAREKSFKDEAGDLAKVLRVAFNIDKSDYNAPRYSDTSRLQSLRDDYRRAERKSDRDEMDRLRRQIIYLSEQNDRDDNDPFKDAALKLLKAGPLSQIAKKANLEKVETYTDLAGEGLVESVSDGNATPNFRVKHALRSILGIPVGSIKVAKLKAIDEFMRELKDSDLMTYIEDTSNFESKGAEYRVRLETSRKGKEAAAKLLAELDTLNTSCEKTATATNGEGPEQKLFSPKGLTFSTLNEVERAYAHQSEGVSRVERQIGEATKKAEEIRAAATHE